MKAFTKTLKLEHNTHRKQITLSILCSPNLVMSFLIKEDRFSRMRSAYLLDSGYQDDDLLIQLKADYVRFTKFAPGMEHNFRIEIGKWQELLKNHHDLIESSSKEIITVEIE